MRLMKTKGMNDYSGLVDDIREADHEIDALPGRAEYTPANIEQLDDLRMACGRLIATCENFIDEFQGTKLPASPKGD